MPSPGAGQKSQRSVDRSDRVTRDQQLAELAEAQHVVFSLAQLRELGISRALASKRARSGRLHRVHLAVYSLVPPARLSRRGRYMAAVLACGPGAALSHRSAASLLGLRTNSRSRIEVIVPHRRARSHQGVQAHRPAALRADEVEFVDGIPCTTLARTALDLAAVVPVREVERALNQAEVLEVFDLRTLEEQLTRHPRHPGAKRLRAALTTLAGGPTVTFSDFEEAMLSIVDGAGLPRPEVNQWLVLPDGGPAIRADFLWRSQRLVVETDGWDTHRTRQSFELNRLNDQRLVEHGYRVPRLTWRHVHDERPRIDRLIRKLLA